MKDVFTVLLLVCLDAMRAVLLHGRRLLSTAPAVAAASRKEVARRAKQLVELRSVRDQAKALAALGKLQPLRSATEYTIAIDACGRVEAWKQALDLLHGMGSADGGGVAPNVYTFTAAMTACTRAGQIEPAYELLASMREAKVKPNVFTYTILLSGMVAQTQRSPGPKYERIDQLWSSMLADGVGPNLRTYRSAILACERSRHVAAGTAERAKFNEKAVALVHDALPSLESLIDQLDQLSAAEGGEGGRGGEGGSGGGGGGESDSSEVRPRPKGRHKISAPSRNDLEDELSQFPWNEAVAACQATMGSAAGGGGVAAGSPLGTAHGTPPGTALGSSAGVLYRYAIAEDH
jgi:pentatricopeptide repeat protein